MSNEELRTYLTSRFACKESLRWLGDRDSDRMWAECERDAWMLWWILRIPDSDQIFALYAAAVCGKWRSSNLEVCNAIRRAIPICPLPKEKRA